MPKIKKPGFRKSPATSRAYMPIFSLRTKILIFSGLFLMLVPIVFYINQTIQLMYIVPTVPETAAAPHPPTAEPVKIVIPTIRVTLPIEETMINNNVWGIAANAVSHLGESADPGEPGPIILYAHNTNERFGPIRWLTTGDVIELIDANGKTFRYAVNETVQTDPDELSVFFQRKSEALYLFTCDGFADLKRYIVIAEPTATASTSASQPD